MAKERSIQNRKNGNLKLEKGKGCDYKEKGLIIKEKERWRRRWRGEEAGELVGECTMPGCHVRIFSDCEYYTDDSGNIFCSLECVMEWYGLRKNTG